LEQWDKYMMPIDLGEIEAELEAAASSGRLTSRVSMETCRCLEKLDLDVP
jgi:hypothetical protein